MNTHFLLDRFFKIEYQILLLTWYRPKAKRAIKMLSKDKTVKELYAKEIEALNKCLTLYPTMKSVETSFSDIVCQYDSEAAMWYVLLDGKRLYFKKGNTKKDVLNAYKALLEEQSDGCPHQYIPKNFVFPQGTVLIDAGCAEGNFALMNIEKVDRVLLIEADKEWDASLRKTFEPWKNKVEFIYTYISEKSDDKYTSLDDIVKTTILQGRNDNEISETKLFLKMDLEGFGLQALHGAKKILNQNKCYVVNASYHSPTEYDDFTDFFRNNCSEYSISATEANMFPYFFRDFKYPFFRKAMFRASNWE